MFQSIQAQNISLEYLEEKFQLQELSNQTFFPELLDNLPEVTELEKQYLDRVKANFLRLLRCPPLLENAVKMVVISPLLDLGGFYAHPFTIKTEESIEITLEDEAQVIKGRIDILVIQAHFWLLVIESKRLKISISESIAQALTYMLGNPNPEKSSFGLVTNGTNFIFLKLTKQNQVEYVLSDELSLLKRENDLYRVLQILRKISQVLS
jgi:hypothetical protein